MAFPLTIPEPLRAALADRPAVLLALSGGVDSGLALALLSELGCEVGCVTFKNFCYGDTGPDDGRACCSQEAIADAGRLAARFGASHRVADVSDLFRAAVIEPFVTEYAAGRTPNPCLACNARVRFPHLVALADRWSYATVATGHYARIAAPTRGPDGESPAALLRGVDAEKDQSYFLYRVTPDLLARTVFPLGWYTKTEVRRAARELDLPVAAKPESQEICFVPDGDRSFLFPSSPADANGDIVDSQGQILGRHRGLVHYTVGQRRGLGIAAAQPLYVVALEAAANRLVVGPREELARNRIVCDDIVAHVPDLTVGDSDGMLARIRHRHAGVPVRSWRRNAEQLDVELEEAVQGAAPGQALVLYDGDRVLGGGRILTTSQM